ncbi:dipeptidase [Bacteroidetes/Chlorobi group bacterium Naka2016]|jgi:acetylornithine deacetylase/succinyl-diaminopimelate desuccinylase-like protein|nr:MAG: dipeptidase [Bacteroidetes/Chlorobi group bacterium Naka2016]
MNKVKDYIVQNRELFLNQLIDFLKFPSISSRSEHKEDVRNCANWLANHIKSLGAENVNVFETKGHPIVYAEYLHNENAPTVLVYGHYDVQPVDPLDLWNSNPFEPVVKDNKIFARGTSDDKGQLFIHLKAFETVLNTIGTFPINIKFIFEGEEEAGSNHLDEFIEQNSKLLECDTVLISDTEWFDFGLPSICYALRGIAFVEIKVKGPNRDLHSGSYGGAVDNPAEVLAYLISRLKDRYGRITIPGFYDKVLELSTEEREEFARLPFNEQNYCQSIGIKQTYGENGFSVLERTWARPTFEINGIYGGYTGEGAKTIIPSEASAKISMRLVPNQVAKEILDLFSKYIKEITPPTVDIEIKPLHGGNPVMTPIDTFWMRKAKEALQIAFGVEPVFIREGGSIPVCETFQRVLGASPVLIGFGLPTDNIHSPNENFSLDNFFGGINAIANYYLLLNEK